MQKQAQNHQVYLDVAECRFILCKDIANEYRIIKFTWMLCRVPLYLMQRYRQRVQNHQVYLNVMLSAALSYAKVRFYLLT